MTIDATGTIRTTPTGRELVLERTFPAPIADVWASITEPERSDRWIGTWTGEAAPGRTVSFTMTAEDAAEPEDVLILECDAPRRLHVEFPGNVPAWRLAVDLVEADGTTTLTFTQEVSEGLDVSDVGPGWEYYLDRLVADLAGTPFADFDDYYPHQRPHYESA